MNIYHRFSTYALTALVAAFAGANFQTAEEGPVILGVITFLAILVLTGFLSAKDPS